jgi:hypothetical protein
MSRSSSTRIGQDPTRADGRQYAAGRKLRPTALVALRSDP